MLSTAITSTTRATHPLCAAAHVPRPFGPLWHSVQPVGDVRFVQLLGDLRLCVAELLLDDTEELVLRALRPREIVLRQLGVGPLHAALELVPLALNLILVHISPPSVYMAWQTPCHPPNRRFSSCPGRRGR